MPNRGRCAVWMSASRLPPGGCRARRSHRRRPTTHAFCRRSPAIAGSKTGSIGSKSTPAGRSAARFKWSRDNGSIVSAVGDIAVAGGQTTLTVNRLGRDQVLRFVVGNWVTVTDDFRELVGEPGEMARIIAIDETNTKLVLDRGLPTGSGRPFGANPAELAGRHTRVQRWDQSAPANTVDADGLIATATGPLDIEEGIRVSFSADPAGGAFNDGDYWVFWARTATARSRC